MCSRIDFLLAWHMYGVVCFGTKREGAVRSTAVAKRVPALGPPAPYNHSDYKLLGRDWDPLRPLGNVALAETMRPARHNAILNLPGPH